VDTRHFFFCFFFCSWSSMKWAPCPMEAWERRRNAAIKVEGHETFCGPALKRRKRQGRMAFRQSQSGGFFLLLLSFLFLPFFSFPFLESCYLSSKSMLQDFKFSSRTRVWAIQGGLRKKKKRKRKPQKFCNGQFLFGSRLSDFPCIASPSSVRPPYNPSHPTFHTNLTLSFFFSPSSFLSFFYSIYFYFFDFQFFF